MTVGRPTDRFFATSVVDPDPGYGAFLTLGNGICDEEKNADPGSVMNIPDHFSESLETVFRVRNT